MDKLKITQIRSVINRPEKQKRTIEALGLGSPNNSRIIEDTPQMRGMLKVVEHLLKIEAVEAKG
jgi:large subunit ribosomal protein L30